MMTGRGEELRRRLRGLGFDAVRFARLGPEAVRPMSARFSQWLGAGHHADMHWMERGAEKRAHPELVLADARSMILLGVNYGRDAAATPRFDLTRLKSTYVETKTPAASAAAPLAGALAANAPAAGTPAASANAAAGPAGGARPATAPVWARYALHSDYHDTIKAGLAAAGRALEELFGVAGADYRYYVDTGPVLERGWAERAGLGFVGKNAMLISREFGNWLFLAVILTRLELEPDEPLPQARKWQGASDKYQEKSAVPVPPPAPAGFRFCGKCERCMTACPTAAITAPGVLDARRCVSYQTIENRGMIPRGLREGIGARIYGCDVCAEVCPWNRFARDARSTLLEARGGVAALSLREVLELTPGRFAEVFRKMPIKRVKLPGLLRNACVVAGNTGAADCLDVLARLAVHASPVVRAHAVWAVRRIAGPDKAPGLLEAARMAERDADVLAEYEG
jgi:epoxyqueuosine reductase